MTQKKLLFSVTKDDLEVTAMRGSGAGGQHRNKTSSAVRIRHPASGAEGLSQSERSQHRNKRIALQRLVASKKFQLWVRLEAAARAQGEVSARALVDKQMAPEHLKIEVGDGENWKEV